jgi:hypothetical protein
MGSFLLLKLYRHFRQDRNDFTNTQEYFVSNAVYCALGDLRVPDAKMALIEALQTNDNSRNAFDDSYRLATIVAALGNCTGDHHRRETNDIVDRLLTMDRLVPSYRNVVTQAGLLVSLRRDWADLDPCESDTGRPTPGRSATVLVVHQGRLAHGRSGNRARLSSYMPSTWAEPDYHRLRPCPRPPRRGHAEPCCARFVRGDPGQPQCG